jgi:hypothetical protein
VWAGAVEPAQLLFVSEGKGKGTVSWPGCFVICWTPKTHSNVRVRPYTSPSSAAARIRARRPRFGFRARMVLKVHFAYI